MAFKIVEPMNRTVYIKYRPVEEKAIEGGKIIAPRMHSELTRVGTVMAKGKECKLNFKVGDTVLTTFHAGVAVDWAGGFITADDTERLVDEFEILAVIEL